MREGARVRGESGERTTREVDIAKTRRQARTFCASSFALRSARLRRALTSCAARFPRIASNSATSATPTSRHHAAKTFVRTLPAAAAALASDVSALMAHGRERGG